MPLCHFAGFNNNNNTLQAPVKIWIYDGMFQSKIKGLVFAMQSIGPISASIKFINTSNSIAFYVGDYSDLICPYWVLLPRHVFNTETIRRAIYMFSTSYIKITSHLLAICLTTQLDNLSQSLIVVAVNAMGISPNLLFPPLR
jgi:hypothetical protein